MTTPAVRYPAGEVTPHGWWHLTNDTRPMMRLRAFDESIDFYMLGGYAPPYNDPTQPEGVAVKALKGLVPPWRHIDQKGATEDGVTQIDALYDPTEIEMVVECCGRDPKSLRRVVRDLIGSLDAKKESELSWLTHDLGYWWAPIRWFKGAPPDPMMGPQTKRQQLSLRLRADHAFWRSYEDNALFAFKYEAMVDEFTTDYSADHNLGPNWPQHYSGPGAGYCSTIDFELNFGIAAFIVNQARWYESGTDPREVVNGPYKDFETDTDNQVVEMKLGTLPEITFFGECFNDVWARMNRNPDGTWGGDGYRARIGLEGIFGWVELTRFVNFVGTTLYSRLMIIPPLAGETFRLVCGDESDPHLMRVTRNGLTILTFKDASPLALLDASHRGIGFGMAAGHPLLGTQKAPAWVMRVAAGDNATISQSGFLKRTNVGDQPMFDNYTFFGPGTVQIWDGPGSDDYVEFGPLLPNQIVYIRTDPRRPGIDDLTTVPPTPQQLNQFQQLLEDFESFAFANNIPPLLQQINSFFGIVPPQGNLYSLLNGRFSDNAAIPPKSPGNPVAPYYVKVAINGGNADSKLLASGIPLRRYPI